MDHGNTVDEQQQQQQHDKGTIYITIGPQCAGKTTILKQLFGTSQKNHHYQNDDLLLDTNNSHLQQHQQHQQQEEEEMAGLDVTIDDQTLVYLSLPTAVFLNHSSSVYDTTPAMKQTCDDSIRTEVIFGKSILSRVADRSMDELLWVLQRLNNQIDAKFFASRIRDDNDDDDNDDDDKNNISKMNKTQSAEKIQPSRTTQDDLIDAVEYVIQSKHDEGITNNILPKTVDLFIVESIFRPRPLSLMSRYSGTTRMNPLLPPPPDNSNNVTETTCCCSGLEAAQTTLQTLACDSTKYPSTSPLSWGNTNTRPREYITALDAAERSQRPVQFIIYGGLEACDKIRNCAFQRDDDLKLCLFKATRLTLLQRNIRRFVETGRYIPSLAISDAIERVNSMIATAVAEANKEENHASTSSSLSLCEVTNDAKFRLDYELAKLAGYHLHANRTVSSLVPPDNNNHHHHHHRDGNHHSSSGGSRGNNKSSNNAGRGANNNRGRNTTNSSHRERGGGGGGGQNNQDYRRGNSGRGGRRSYSQDYLARGRGDNHHEGGDSFQSRQNNGGRGGSYNSPSSDRRGRSSYHQGGRYPNQGYGGRNSNQYGDSKMDDRFETRGNSRQYDQRSRGNNDPYGRGRGS